MVERKGIARAKERQEKTDGKLRRLPGHAKGDDAQRRGEHTQTATEAGFAQADEYTTAKPTNRMTGHSVTQVVYGSHCALSMGECARGYSGE